MDIINRSTKISLTKQIQQRGTGYWYKSYNVSIGTADVRIKLQLSASFTTINFKIILRGICYSTNIIVLLLLLVINTLHKYVI